MIDSNELDRRLGTNKRKFAAATILLSSIILSSPMAHFWIMEKRQSINNEDSSA
jgi:hypothetical protein